MSITNKNKQAISNYFSSYESAPKPERNPSKTKQMPTNLANRKLANAFMSNFGEKVDEELYYHRDDLENDIDAFHETENGTQYDPYAVMKN